MQVAKIALEIKKGKMKQAFLLVFVFVSLVVNSQVISTAEVERIEKTLSSDEMQGRAVFTPGIDKAADFIASEFKKAGLKPVKGDSYFQEFAMQRAKVLSLKGKVDGADLDPAKVGVMSGKKDITVNTAVGFKKIRVEAGKNFPAELQRLSALDSNFIVVVDTSYTRVFNFFRNRRESMVPRNTIVMVLSPADINTYDIEISQEITELKLKNVVGVLTGNRKEEFVIFSGHYDHLGIRKPNKDADSIYNGANDDASGVTAVILLANHYAKEKNRERTLLFAAFTAEESGGYGATYFSREFDPLKVMAMFNIEMIGTESKWGTNSAFITGYEMTDMGKILQSNLKETNFTFHPDPYPAQQLFYRSDNATLARLGVPAHTISTSKMDSEPYYHTADDEFETLDMKNMTEIIKAIALSSRSIVAGKDTPSRVDAGQMKR